MRWLLAALVLVAVLALSGPGGPVAQARPRPAPAPLADDPSPQPQFCNVVAVKLAPGTDPVDLPTVAGASWRPLPFGGWVVLHYVDVPAATAACCELCAVPGVLEVVHQTCRPVDLSAPPVDDPLFDEQWHLLNELVPGEDCNAPAAWAAGFTGSGVPIGVIDTGVQIGHPDLEDNYSAALSYDFFSDDPNPDDPEGHGTNVAGLAAAVGNNATGVSGVARNATLVGLRNNPSLIDAVDAGALSHEPQQIPIYTNSWSPLDGAYAYIQPLSDMAIENGLTNGRGGLGSIYIFSAGNGGTDKNANATAYQNRIGVICVGTVDRNGRIAHYSEPGACVLVSAHAHAVPTTDLQGTAGSSAGDYADFAGTSAASPVVAGVVALMLEANPSLTWRDVMHVLALSAHRSDPGDDLWQYNGVGLPVHLRFGFGAVDAGEAVALAQTWSTLPARTVATSGTVDVSQSIPSSNPLTVELDITDTLSVERVQVVADFEHDEWGELLWTLTSPTGTVSELSSIGNTAPPPAQDGWTFSSVHCLGEPATGTWAVSVVAESGGGGSLASLELIVHGTATPLFEMGDIDVTADNPADESVLPDTTNVTAGRFDADVASGSAIVSSVEVSISGSGHDVNDVNAVKLYLDMDLSGTLSPGADMLLGSTVFDGDDGDAMFGGLSLPIAMRHPATLIVALDLAETAAVDDTFTVALEAITADGAVTGLPLAGRTLTIESGLVVDADSPPGPTAGPEETDVWVGRFVCTAVAAATGIEGATLRFSGDPASVFTEARLLLDDGDAEPDTDDAVLASGAFDSGGTLELTFAVLPLATDEEVTLLVEVDVAPEEALVDGAQLRFYLDALVIDPGVVDGVPRAGALVRIDVPSEPDPPDDPPDDDPDDEPTDNGGEEWPTAVTALLLALALVMALRDRPQVQR